MKYQCLIFVFLPVLICCVADAQTVEHEMIDKNTGGLLYIYQAAEMHGHPFFKDKWMDASITVSNGHVFKHIITKIDTYNNKVIFNRNDSAFELGPIAAEVCFFPDQSDTSKKIIFKNGYAVNNFITASKYLEVLAEGKISLLKDYHKELEEYTEYGNATKQKRYREVEQYYVLKDGQYSGMGLSKKNLQAVLQSRWVEVDAFLKQTNISGKDEKSWAAAIAYFNLL